MSHLAFADDLMILAKNPEEGRTKLRELEKCTAKTGLRVSYEKTEPV